MAASDPSPSSPLARHETLVAALRARLAAGGPPPLLAQTHISSVIVAPPFAYKLKKPVDLGFLDFSSLAARRRFCDEELRLNRRLAPGLYLDVVPITGTPEAPLAGGTGEPIDYALRMRAFEQDDLWERRVAAGRLAATETVALGRRIAAFHLGLPAAPSPSGEPAAIRRQALANFESLRRVADPAAGALIDGLARDEAAGFARLAPVMAARNRAGFVRECHGDLHLGNVVTIGGEPVAFDCIEFDANLRRIDVMSEVAFMTMDLAHAGRPDLGMRFLDSYLQVTGDFAGVSVLRYYLAYRALVRAKVAALKAPGAADVDGYLRLAGSLSRRGEPLLVLMHGLSGSGKSVLAEPLAAAIGAIRLRSDVERKRARGVPPLDRSASDATMYAAAQRGQVYERLATLAAGILGDGFPVLVDASFLERAQRARFAGLAREHGARLAIVDLHAPLDVLRARLAARSARGDDPSDADVAVLERQLATREALDAGEADAVLAWRATDPVDEAGVARLARAARGATSSAR